jgi:hypothetical protein
MDIRKLLPLSGVVFVVVLVLGVLVFGGDTPDSNASGGKVLSYYDAHQTGQAVSAFVLAAIVFFLVCFAITLATALWPADAERRPVWEILLIAGSTLTGAVLLLEAAVHFALTDGANNDASASALQALNLIDGDMWVAFNAGLGVMMIGAAGSLIPRAGTYRRLGWAALLLGIVLFVPYVDFLGLLLTLVWIVVVSVMLFRARSTLVREAPAPA